MKEISKRMLFGTQTRFQLKVEEGIPGNSQGNRASGHRRTEVFRNSVEGMGRGVMQEAGNRAQVNRKAERERRASLRHGDRQEQAGLYVNPLPFFPQQVSRSSVNWKNQSYFCIFK